MHPLFKINTKLAESSLQYFIPQLLNNTPEIITDLMLSMKSHIIPRIIL